jgi:hypothetical protein
MAKSLDFKPLPELTVPFEDIYRIEKALLIFDNEFVKTR